jgi:CRP/FNR family transcriptional regulator
MELKLSPLPLLAAHPLFDKNPEFWQQVAQYIKTKRFDKDDVVVHHGDAAGSLWLVLSGWVKLTRQTPDGKESIIGLCTGGDVFGEAALFQHANYPYTAEIVSSSAELVSIPSTTIRTLIAKEPKLSAHVTSVPYAGEWLQDH